MTGLAAALAGLVLVRFLAWRECVGPLRRMAEECRTHPAWYQDARGCWRFGRDSGGRP